MSSTAWIDESMRQHSDRSSVYVLAAAVVSNADVPAARFDAARLAPGRRARVHYRDADDGERRKLVQAVAAITTAAHVVVVGAGMDRRRQERARRVCLERLLWRLDGSEVEQVFIEARTASLNTKDRNAVAQLKQRRIIPGHLRVDFARPHGAEGDPLLWLPDVVAGVVGTAHGSAGRTSLLAPLRTLLRIEEVALR
ncbi:hypothetical protein GCM10029963_44900 [Micromonospora andamanensis]|uniref:hypothetical protein n=1 Tax=Micromonospora andamanensis TaxID=1287068 RepID=UPI00194E01B6|nr:hypothetical protein [Micromonospora andamanensis]GIJ39441.1 hypothetical protein Vwe01_27660 [Micromonospora andamanensis]